MPGFPTALLLPGTGEMSIARGGKLRHKAVAREGGGLSSTPRKTRPVPSPAPGGCSAGRSLQAPRKPKLTSRHVRSRSAPGRLSQHPPHHALSHQHLLTQHQPPDFTGTSRFPAGKGPATPLFTEGLLWVRRRGKSCPDEQTRDRNKPPRFLPVSEVSNPAQGLLFPPPPPSFFLMKTPSKNNFFHRKRAGG